MTTTIEAQRDAMHKAVDSLLDAASNAAVPVELPAEVRAQLEAIGAKVVMPKVNEAVIGQVDDAVEVLKMGIQSVRSMVGTTRNARPDNEKDTFLNSLAGIPESQHADAARSLMVKKLEGVSTSKYKLFPYHDGRMRGSAQKPDGTWVEVGAKSGGYVTPGSFAWKIKDIIKGEIQTAS